MKGLILIRLYDIDLDIDYLIAGADGSFFENAVLAYFHGSCKFGFETKLIFNSTVSKARQPHITYSSAVNKLNDIIVLIWLKSMIVALYFGTLYIAVMFFLQAFQIVPVSYVYSTLQ